MKKELVSILSDLIALPSPYPPGTSVEICAYAAKRLKEAGYKVEIATKAKGVDNVVARRKGKAKGPTIAFNAHVDTVGVGERANWKSDPYKALVKGGLVYGLGAGNCKGSMAVQLWLAEEIARRGGPAKGELIFTFVADEENLGPNGMEFLRKSGKVRPDALILGAQTENNLIVAERGVMWAKITTKGKAAHAGNPSAGDNAILRMMRLVGALQSYYDKALAKRVAGAMKSTVNIGMFHGGHNTNVVPSACTVEIDRRLLPDETVKAAFAELKKVIDGAGEPQEPVHGRVPDRHQRLLRPGERRRGRRLRGGGEGAHRPQAEVPQRHRRERRPLLRRRRHRDHQLRPRLGRAGPRGERERSDQRDGRGGGDPAGRGGEVAGLTHPLISSRTPRPR